MFHPYPPTSSDPSRRRVSYILSQELVKTSSLLPSNRNRSFLVHSLISKLELLSSSVTEHPCPITVVRPRRATRDELCLYHDSDYINFVLDERDLSSEYLPTQNEEYGIEDDCPPFPGLSSYVQLVAGATLTAVNQLISNLADVAICWDGGRHHAQKTHASGFCYVADCILAILALKKSTLNIPPYANISARKPRIMYLDLDLHFSDAVTQCFYNSSRSRTMPHVLTLSIHHSGPGFFPISDLAALSDPEQEHFDPFSLSIPLKQGASAQTFARIWPTIESVKDAFCPDYVIVQCGADGLSGDPCGVWNWSINNKDGDMVWCVQKIVHEWNCKVLLLGGGGYNSTNVARAWAQLTAVTRGRRISEDTVVPDHAAFPLYGPSFAMDVPAGNMNDDNTQEYLLQIENVYKTITPRIRERISP